MFQVQSTPNDVSLLWKPATLRLIRRRFFEGNQLLEKQRTAATLRAYIAALRLFFTFAKAKVDTLATIGVSVDAEASRQIDGANQLLDGWLKTLSRSVHIRRSQLRKRDDEEMLSMADLKSILESAESRSITADMLALEGKVVGSISRDDFARYLFISMTIAFLC